MKLTLFLFLSCLLSLLGCATTKQSTLSTQSSTLKKTPTLSEPRYRTLWVPDKIEGDRYIEGHRVFIIEDSGKWLTE